MMNHRSRWLTFPAAILMGSMLPVILPLQLPALTTIHMASQVATFTAPDTFPIQFSIQYPIGWQVDASSENYIIITSYQPRIRTGVAAKQAIKTDVTLVSGSFEQIVRQNQRNILEDDSRVIRRGFLKVGGRDGQRLWTTGSSFDFPDSILTYVRYSNDKTAVLVSYYTASNRAAVPIIQQIHGSFRVTK